MLLTNCTDSELWEAISLDSTKAFDVLFERYWSVIYGTAFSYLKDSEASAQVVNDIFLQLWQKRKEYEIRSFKQYLTSAARYHVYRQLKTAKQSAISYIEDYEVITCSGQVRNQGDENITYLELEQVVQHSLNQLPKRCQEIFALSRTGHLTNDEISERLGISKRTVENQITTALQLLRSVLKYSSILLLIVLL